MGNDRNCRTTVDLYVSTAGTAVWDRQQHVIDRLEQLESEGIIDHHRVQIWCRQVSLSGPLADTQFHRSAAKTAEEFEAWADRKSEALELPFEREAVSSDLTGHEYRILRPPAICMALYEGDELSGVFPCEVEGENCTIESMLERIAELEEAPGEVERSVEAAR